MNTIRIALQDITIDNDRQCLQVRFMDQTMTPAAPNRDAASLERAEALGFTSMWQATVYHELAHCLVSRAMGSPVSKVLHGDAMHRAGTGGYARFWAFEEQVVFSLCSYANGNPWKHWLECLGFNTGVYLDCLGWHLGSKAAVDALAAELRARVGECLT